MRHSAYPCMAAIAALAATGGFAFGGQHDENEIEGETFKYEVLTREASCNRTAVERCFEVAGDE